MTHLELRFAEALDVLARKVLRVVEGYAAKARLRYVATRPLTSSERELLAKRVASGGALCCPQGLEWLREQLPEIWAQAINDWAYVYLACCVNDDQERLNRYADQVRKLSLDRLPTEES